MLPFYDEEMKKHHTSCYFYYHGPAIRGPLRDYHRHTHWNRYQFPIYWVVQR